MSEVTKAMVEAIRALKIKHAGQDSGNGYRWNEAIDECIKAALRAAKAFEGEARPTVGENDQ